MGSQASSFKEADFYVENPISDQQIRQIHEETVLKEDSFWKQAKQLPIYSIGITAWKFMTILHEILWIADHDFIKRSQSELQTVSYVQNSWIALYNYGQLNNLIGKYLVNLLTFYKDIPFHHSRADLTFDELKKIIGTCSSDDWGAVFRKIVDLQDKNLEFQIKLLKSMKNLKLDGDKPKGQCRVLPIILCLKEAYQLRKIASQILKEFPGVAEQTKDIASRYQEQNEKFEKNREEARKYKIVSDNLPN